MGDWKLGTGEWNQDTHLEEFLVEDESHSTDLVHGHFLSREVVDEIGSYRQCQLTSQFLPIKP